MRIVCSEFIAFEFYFNIKTLFLKIVFASNPKTTFLQQESKQPSAIKKAAKNRRRSSAISTGSFSSGTFEKYVVSITQLIFANLKLVLPEVPMKKRYRLEKKIREILPVVQTFV